MKPAPFEYVAPESVEEALAALQQNNPDGKILAGGQSLLPLLNLRLTKPKLLVDLNGISGLDGIRETPEGLAIGAMTRQSKLEHSLLVRQRCPLLAEAIRYIGHVAIRHRGTIGGSLAHADPAAELPALALALDAKFAIAGRGTDRVISAEEFFLDFLTTALAPDEILRQIVFPIIRPSSGYALEEIARRHGDFAIAGVVVIVDLDDAGKIAEARVALFGLAPTPVRARQAERALVGRELDDRAMLDAAVLLEEVLEPPGDIRASSAYRKHAAAVLLSRALKRAVQVCHTRRIP
ncbi:MAG TPA: xanthine dehydrogenase family protein subunit M [Candidatus Binatia bacterium]|nr:xanthine dehydrogenase family protein subunit M [Candidatus Binatia bacterium]